MNIKIQAIDTCSDKKLQELSSFLSKVFPKTDKFSPEFVKWQYRECPDGAMIGFNAYDGDRLVSHFAALPLKMSFYKKIYKGAVSINVSTDPAYQGKKLFTKLGQATVDYAKNNGFDFLLAVPNANSTHAFLKYFDFKIISPLTVRVGFGLPKYKKIEPNIYKVWNTELMKWRIKNPTNKYFISKDQIQTPISFFAKSVSRKGIEFPNSLEQTSFRPVSLFVGLGVDFSKLFFKLPKWVKISPFNLVFKDLTGGKISHIKKEDFFIQLIDLDVI